MSRVSHLDAGLHGVPYEVVINRRWLLFDTGLMVNGMEWLMKVA